MCYREKDDREETLQQRGMKEGDSQAKLSGPRAGTQELPPDLEARQCNGGI